MLGNITITRQIVQWTSYTDATVVNISLPTMTTIGFCQVQFYLSPSGYIEIGCSEGYNSFGLGYGLLTIAPPWVQQVAWFGILNVTHGAPTGVAFEYLHCYNLTTDPYIPAAIPAPNTVPCEPLPPSTQSFPLASGMFSSFTVYPSVSGACAPDIWITLPGLGISISITSTDGTIYGPQVVFGYNLNPLYGEPFLIFNGTFLNMLGATVFWIAIDITGQGYFGVGNNMQLCSFNPALSRINNYGTLFTSGYSPNSRNLSSISTVQTTHLTDWQITYSRTQSLAAMCSGNLPPADGLLVGDVLFFDSYIYEIYLDLLCANSTGIVWSNSYLQVWITFLGLGPITAVSVTSLPTYPNPCEPIYSTPTSQYYPLSEPIGNSSFIYFNWTLGSLVLGSNSGNISNPVFHVITTIMVDCNSMWCGLSNMQWSTFGPWILSAYSPSPTPAPTNTLSTTQLPSVTTSSTTGPSHSHVMNTYKWILCSVGSVVLMGAIVAVYIVVRKRIHATAADPERQAINNSHN
jgi:hypothetical protein